MFNFSDKSNEDKTGIILFALGLVFLGITTYVGFTKLGLWNDEFFSIYIVNMHPGDLVIRATQDVHPVLYYFIYKFFIKLLSPFAGNIIIGRLVSLIPFYLIAVLSVTKVRERFGWLTAGIFFLCMSCMPQLMLFAVEIRMYSWALLFVTASVIYAYDLIDEPNLKNWAILTVLSICSFYTHYFSGVASGIIYLLLLVYFIKNNRSMIKTWIVSVVLVAVAFLPWVMVVMSQISRISGAYWIDPITANTVIGYVFFVLSPADIFVKGNEVAAPSVLGVLMILAFIVLIYKYRDKFAICCIIGFILIPVSGILLSQIFSPIFHARYMVPALGGLWLAFSILLAKSFDDKRIFIPILVLVLAIGIVGTVDFIHIQDQDVQLNSDEYNGLRSVIAPGDIVVIGSHKFTFALENYYLKDNDVFCFESNLEDNITNLVNNSTILAKLDNGSRIFYINHTATLPNDEIYKTSFQINQLPGVTTVVERNVTIFEVKV